MKDSNIKNEITLFLKYNNEYFTSKLKKDFFLSKNKIIFKRNINIMKEEILKEINKNEK